MSTCAVLGAGRRRISRPRGIPDRRRWHYSLKAEPTLRHAMRMDVLHWRSQRSTGKLAWLSGLRGAFVPTVSDLPNQAMHLTRAAPPRAPLVGLPEVYFSITAISAQSRSFRRTLQP